MARGEHWLLYSLQGMHKNCTIMKCLELAQALSNCALKTGTVQPDWNWIYVRIARERGNRHVS